MSQIINPQLDGEVSSTTRQLLDGVEFRLTITWLSEVARVPFYDQTTPPPPLVFGEPGVWVLDLAQADGTILISGQVLRAGVNVLQGYKGDARFPGVGFGRLLANDYSGARQDPGRDDLDVGSPRRLVYVTAAEGG